MDGFILVDKEKDITSFSLVNKIKKNLNLDKTGHTGTLDPNATGLMIVATNRATRLLKLLEYDEKEYIATIVFGLNSDTLDVKGNILDDISMNFNLNELKEACEKLKKEETQIPPMTSAIKIDGKKLYEYQRENKQVEIKPRNVKLIDYEILNELHLVDNHLEIDIRLKVSKGYYIRSFARDLGKLLNGYAILKDLRRISVGNFSINDAKKIQELSISDIIPIEKFLKLPKVEVKPYLINMIKNGIVLDERQTNLKEPFFVVNNNEILAIYEPKEDNKYKAVYIF